MKKLLITSLSLIVSQTVFGIDNFCSRHSSYENIAQSKCIGSNLPRGRLRNMKRSSHAIVCSGNVDSFVRKPQKFDLNEWEARLSVSSDIAQDYARKELKPIAWSGTTTYRTFETWAWETCDLVTNGFICGYDTRYQEVDITYTDSNGNLRSKSEKQAVQVPKSCYSDVQHTEYIPCTTEFVDYKAEFDIPSKSEWNPQTAGYYDQIPLKYDLLPGEVEAIQTYSSKGNYKSRVTPAVEIPSAWNEYRIDIDRTQLACDQIAKKGLPRQEFNYKIFTIKRNVGHKSPNAFRLPVDFDGNPLESVIWDSGIDNKGVEHEKAFPMGVQLIDTSAAMVNLMAEQSRQNKPIESAKLKSGKLSNQDGYEISELEKEHSFFKNTKVKVEIIDKNNFWFNNLFGAVRTEDINSVKASLNGISEDQDIQRSDLWHIKLKGKQPGVNDIYEGWNLKPNKKDYIISISMYQKNIPFYNQSCEDSTRDEKWYHCGWVKKIGFGKKEKHYYSESLDIPISTSGFDKRSLGKKIINFFGWR
ncbi:MAG: hypothetical protein HON90_04640 [Halobacteriovoraceae bacterium]|jgi:hypothetical protein|nr:hypothetical protein [Halobacteriovoraceae bacterium]